MLRNGTFVKEQPVKIGLYYIPPRRHDPTDEEYFIQNAILPQNQNIKDAALEIVIVLGILLVCSFSGIYAWLG